MAASGTLSILAPGEAGETFIGQDLPDGGGAQGSLLGFQGAFDVIDGEVLLAHPQDQLADGVFLGLGMRAVLEFTEEVGLGSAGMMTQDAKGAWVVAKAAAKRRTGKDVVRGGAGGSLMATGVRRGSEDEMGLT